MFAGVFWRFLFEFYGRVDIRSCLRWGGMEPWLGIDHLRIGIIGCAVNLVTMIVVSLATEEPDEATQKMVDEVRIPKGETVLAASH